MPVCFYELPSSSFPPRTPIPSPSLLHRLPERRQLQSALFSSNGDQWLLEFKRFINFFCLDPGDKNPLSRAELYEDNKR